ncbi:MAG: hypothetical protein AAB383_04655 [Patescibacteria group bacterium]
MLKKFENKFFLVCAALVLVFNGLLYAFAAETELVTDVPKPVDGTDFQCGYDVMQEAQVLVDSYQVFLDDYFKQVTPSSEQVDGAMKYYRLMEFSIQKIYQSNLRQDTNFNLNSSIQANSYCAYVRDLYLDIASAMLQKQVIASSSSKRTFLMVDGLKATNEHMEIFADEFSAVFPGFFTKFNNALPCYAHQCINK